MRSKVPLSFCTLLMLASAVSIGHAQDSKFSNPILPGAHPDPSICRVGESYYLVNSSFEYFPGLPIHRSSDLVNWQLIGYGLHRPEQASGIVNLVDVQSDGGIHAPTLRHHDGTFYLISTNVYWHAEQSRTDFVNFILTATNPAGPWSDPHVLEGAPGIDPDIFFDDDGRVWYVGTRSLAEPEFEGQGEIWLQEIDLENWKLVGERTALWRGACDGVWVEGPHLYKRDGRYYLMVAEGGTSFDHAVMIAVSDSIRGPYHSNPRNPILTSRNLSYDNWVHSTGHADLVELPDGRWYMVALGVRGDKDRGSNMGRETHLIPVQWEREPYAWKPIRYEWPVCAPETGKVERWNPMPFPKSAVGGKQDAAAKRDKQDAAAKRGKQDAAAKRDKQDAAEVGGNLDEEAAADQQGYAVKEAQQGFSEVQVAHRFDDSFDGESLDLAWNFRRVPFPDVYSLSARDGYLRLFPASQRIAARGRSALIGFRQRESDFEYVASMEFKPRSDGMEAGICLFQKDDNYISFTVVWEAGKPMVKLALASQEGPRPTDLPGDGEAASAASSTAPSSAASIPASAAGPVPRIVALEALKTYEGSIQLRVRAGRDAYRFDYSADGGADWILVAETPANLILSRGYTGAYLGLYASGNGAVPGKRDYADYDWVRYRDQQR